MIQQQVKPEETKPAGRTASLVVNPSANPKFISFQEEVRSIAAFMDKAVVESTEAVKQVTADLAIISTLKKTIDAKRREYTDPLRNHERALNDLFGSLTGPLDEAYKAGKRKILEYDHDQERLRLLLQEGQLRVHRLSLNAYHASLPFQPQETGSVAAKPLLFDRLFQRQSL